MGEKVSNNFKVLIDILCFFLKNNIATNLNIMENGKGKPADIDYQTRLKSLEADLNQTSLAPHEVTAIAKTMLDYAAAVKEIKKEKNLSPKEQSSLGQAAQKMFMDDILGPR